MAVLHFLVHLSSLSSEFEMLVYQAVLSGILEGEGAHIFA